MEIEIPYNFTYRNYQKRIVNFIRNGGKRAFSLWHRRAGKDKTYFNICIEEAIKKKGGYAYVLPTYAQGKKIIWDSIDKQGKKFKDHIPKEILVGENGTELKYTLANGSFIQILGSENIDTLRGISPRGIVFSEYAFQNPLVWEVMKPILKENGGWAIFNTTPNGKNHAYELYEMAKLNDNWYTELLTIEDTQDENGKRIVTEQDIEEERKEGMTDEMIQQEYYCSFDVGSIGNYYSDLMTQAKDSGRITQIPKNFSLVDIYFDLGRSDQTAVWFKQNDGMFCNFIHYYEDNGKHISKYFDYIDNYISVNKLQIGTIYFPHDSSQKRIEAEKTSLQLAQERYGTHKIHYIPRTRSVNKDIDRVRELIPRCRFDIDEARQGIKCLESYHKKYDDRKKVYSDEADHDWSSHGADSFRYFAVTFQEYVQKTESFELDYSSFL